MTHTPGPWRYLLYGSVDDFGTATRIDVTDSSRTEQPHYCTPVTVCRRISSDGNFSFNPPNAEANARLIAAAPEMLEALKKLCDIRRKQWQECAELAFIKGQMLMPWPDVQFAEAVIDKAEQR